MPMDGQDNARRKGVTTAPTPPNAACDILSPLSNNEVVFLGSVPRKAHSSPFPPPSIKAGSTSFRAEPHRPKRVRTTFNRRIAKAPRKSTIPPSIRNTRVKLGYLLNTKIPVYGCFDNAGNFRCETEVETERASDPGPSTRSIPVSSDEVAYRSEYQGFSYQELQQAVRGRLMTDDSRGEV
jgi:hypothetical protein